MKNKATQGISAKYNTSNKMMFSDYEQRLSEAKNIAKKGKYSTITTNANANKNNKPIKQSDKVSSHVAQSKNSYDASSNHIQISQNAKQTAQYHKHESSNERPSRFVQQNQNQHNKNRNNGSFNQKNQKHANNVVNNQNQSHSTSKYNEHNESSATPSKLDLIFQKQPEQVQKKLKTLLINYNAVMQYNKNQDKFQVDLLLPFANSQQKQKFIEQFLKHRENLKQKQKQSQSQSKQVSKAQHKKNNSNNSANSSRHVQNIKGQEVSDFVIQNYGEYHPGQNVLSQSIRQQLKYEQQFQNQKQILPIDFHQLSLNFDQRLQNSIEAIIRRKRQKLVQKDHAHDHSHDHSKKASNNNIGQKDKNVFEFYQTIKTMSEQHKNQEAVNTNNKVSATSKHHQDQQQNHVQFQNKIHQHEENQLQQNSQSQIQSEHKIRNTPNEPLNFKSPTAIKKNFRQNQNIDQGYIQSSTNSPVQNFFESPIVPYKNQISRSNASSNEILIEDGVENAPYEYFQQHHDSQTDKLFSYRSPNAKDSNNNNNNNSSQNYEYQNSYHSAMDIVQQRAQEYEEESLPTNQAHKNILKTKLHAFSSVQPQPYFKKQAKSSSIGNVNQTVNVNTKLPSRKQSLDRQKSLSNSKQSKDKSKQKNLLRKKYADFLKSNHQHLQKIYENIQRDMKKIQNKKSQIAQNSRENTQILVVEDQEDQQQTRMNRSTQSELKQQALQEYRQRIILQNDSMSSQDKVRYFKYLLKNAKKLYNQYMRNHKKLT